MFEFEFGIKITKIHKLLMGDEIMKVSWIKFAKDKKSFRIFKSLGLDVFDVENPDDTDKKIAELINDNYSTFIISNELASFSEDIIKKYNKLEDINVVILPPKREMGV